MKREIKFRGKSIETGDWFYGSYVYLPDSQTHHIIPCGSYKPHLEAFSIEQVEVDPKTVGQYTGLKDKNSVEIYEGDILDIGDDNTKAYYGFDTLTVEWVDKYACFGQVIKRPVEDVERDLDIVVGSESITPDDYKGWYDYIGSYVIDLCHMLRPSFSQPVPEFTVIGNIHNNPELLKGGKQ